LSIGCEKKWCEKRGGGGGLLPLIAIHPQEGVMKSSGLQCSSKITEALPICSSAMWALLLAGWSLSSGKSHVVVFYKHNTAHIAPIRTDGGGRPPNCCRERHRACSSCFDEYLVLLLRISTVIGIG
jgi:hypothetical protein